MEASAIATEAGGRARAPARRPARARRRTGTCPRPWPLARPRPRLDQALARGPAAVLASLAILAGAAALQTLVFILTGSVALLADLIHNFGDALTAVPLGVAFLLRSERAERTAGPVRRRGDLRQRLRRRGRGDRATDPSDAPSHLGALALAGAIGYAGNRVAARIRLRAGRRLDSAALIADGHHARADAYVSLAVIASAAAVALGIPVADPLIGLAITVVILRITWQSWRTVRGHEHAH